MATSEEKIQAIHDILTDQSTAIEDMDKRLESIEDAYDIFKKFAGCMEEYVKSRISK